MRQETDYGLLNNQADPRFGDRRYGRFGTVAKNGCGMIALYNIERAANKQTRFEPFYAAQKTIKTNLFGLLGTRSSEIPRLLAKKGFSVTDIACGKAGEAVRFDGIIVLYWYFFGAHYVAGIANPDGTYTLYNQFDQPYPMKLADFLTFLKSKKLHPYRVWGIRFPA